MTQMVVTKIKCCAAVEYPNANSLNSIPRRRFMTSLYGVLWILWLHSYSYNDVQVIFQGYLAAIGSYCPNSSSSSSRSSSSSDAIHCTSSGQSVAPDSTSAAVCSYTPAISGVLCCKLPGKGAHWRLTRVLKGRSSKKRTIWNNALRLCTTCSMLMGPRREGDNLGQLPPPEI